jgi:hypothetical protein
MNEHRDTPTLRKRKLSSLCVQTHLDVVHNVVFQSKRTEFDASRGKDASSLTAELATVRNVWFAPPTTNTIAVLPSKVSIEDIRLTNYPAVNLLGADPLFDLRIFYRSFKLVCAQVELSFRHTYRYSLTHNSFNGRTPHPPKIHLPLGRRFDPRRRQITNPADL